MPPVTVLYDHMTPKFGPCFQFLIILFIFGGNDHYDFMGFFFA